MTGEGDIKKQIDSDQVQEEGLFRTSNFERGGKAFVCTLMWRTVSTILGAPGRILQWAGNGVWTGIPPLFGNAGTIYWADSSFVNLISAGQFDLGAGGQTYYFYIDPRMSAYSPVLNTTNAYDAIRDGRVLLCVAAITTRAFPPAGPANMPWRHQTYGGGLNPKV